MLAHYNLTQTRSRTEKNMLGLKGAQILAHDLHIGDGYHHQVCSYLREKQLTYNNPIIKWRKILL